MTVAAGPLPSGPDAGATPTPWQDYAVALLRNAMPDADADAHDGGGVDLDEARDRLLDLPADDLLCGICSLAGLDAAEVEVLALLCAVEVSDALQQRVARLQGDRAQPRVTLAGLARLFPAPHPGPLTVAEGSRLRRAALVDLGPPGLWSRRTAGAAGALVWAACGDRSADPDLPEESLVLPGHGGWPRRDVLHLVAGADRESRRVAAVRELGGYGVLVTPPPDDRTQWDAVVREATVGGLSVLVEVGPEVPRGLRSAVRRADHLAWGLSSPQELPLTSLPDVARHDVRVEDGTASSDEWVRATAGPPPPGVRLDRRQLQLVSLSDAPVPEAVRRLAGGHLERAATRVRPRRGWDALVLAPGLEERVRGLVTRHRGRSTVYDEWGFPGLPSRGTVAMFAGPSGTGKTLAAEVIALELGLDLFVVDLSNVLSKYIGETEQNLGALFDAAETGDAVLFFDEADALFGKRSAVTDAKDRYANVEVAYLLQRLEHHHGMVLLATNLPSNIDDAFQRRLHASLEFGEPGPRERRAIWERAFPAGCPTEGLDLDLLAQTVDLNGGPIATAALAAAFDAASAGSAVTMTHVLDAVSAEYRKQGRLTRTSSGPAPVLS